ncbi:alpha/beta-hydrolase [Xylariaceae sp. FL1651]|nr:alpha/beta-hydrolase [Xylariaceae sp. FL1651]
MVSQFVVAAVSCLIALTTAAPAKHSSLPTVAVKNGSYTGVYSTEYDQDFFLGMPYAKKATRFTVAEPLDTAWNGSRAAAAYPPHCIGYGGDDVGYKLSEDCLYLNVIRPAGLDETADLPVAVWIHGGGLVMGGSADRRYNLSFIVENSVKQGTPMIAVSLNYRLSVFGFLTGSEAQDAGVTNIGFRDQRLALHWVHENIAAFGGSPDKVTIWGESSGAESVSAQVQAYNGRDDGLFRAAIGESGFGGLLYRYPGGLNATSAQQMTFNNLLLNTSCASTVDTAESIQCLRDLPFEEINHAVNVTGVGPWSPVMDGDFIADHPSEQLKRGRFVKVPVLIGTNTDEGTSFGRGKGPNGAGVSTDSEFAQAIRNYLSANVSASSGMSTERIIEEVMTMYPNIQSLGIPSLESWPMVITPNTTSVKSLGLQYRRTGALFGDLAMHYLRRLANISWDKAGVPSWAYRFNVIVNGIPDSAAATHFQEVSFVFYNINGDGYAINPFAGKPDSYRKLAAAMSFAWINFVTGLDPNGDGNTLNVTWPRYSIAAGGGAGQDIVWKTDGSVIEFDDYRAPGMGWLADHSLEVLGM